jgi:FixJ family two-component response regulator
VPHRGYHAIRYRPRTPEVDRVHRFHEGGGGPFLLKPFGDTDLLNAMELALERDAARICERTELADVGHT